jgi:hypothetical protein
MAKNFIDNLSEETKKGLAEKAASGSYPGLAPIGYKNIADPNDQKRRIIVVDPETAPIVKEIFQLYSTGSHSLMDMRDHAHKRGLRSRTGKKIHRSRIEKMLKDVFYHGDFMWGGKCYRGNHLPLISRELFEQVQNAFKTKSKSKGSKRQNLAYIGTLTCGDCGCAVTGERKRKKSGLEFIYYRCTNYHRNCPSSAKYYREEKIDELFTELIRDLDIDEGRIRLIKKA